jgi:hypothetical protein
MSETLRDQRMLFAGLTCMLFSSEPRRILMSGQEYIASKRPAGRYALRSIADGTRAVGANPLPNGAEAAPDC